jgi:hypothetical protein
MNKSTFMTITLTLICATIVLIMLLSLHRPRRNSRTNANGNANVNAKVPHHMPYVDVEEEELSQSFIHACKPHVCGAVDPVSEPDYNMREVIKQSILLEEHLTVPDKRCQDCIAKHMLHIQALIMEAMMLACGTVSRYPMLQESSDFYKKQFDKWLANREDGSNMNEIASALRDWRKRLVQVYILSK